MILLAITVHEFSHGWMANKLGDPTARLAGRLTLNPLAHLDPVGALMLLLVRFGWAKPVPVNPSNLHHPRRDMVWVSLAGPGANVAVALLLGLTFRLLWPQIEHLKTVPFWLAPVLLLVIYGVIINSALAVFNLIPIPPLDGSKILMGILPWRQAEKYSRIEPYGMHILLGLILFGWITKIPLIGLFIWPFVSLFSWLFSGANLRTLDHYFNVLMHL